MPLKVGKVLRCENLYLACSFLHQEAFTLVRGHASEEDLSTLAAVN